MPAALRDSVFVLIRAYNSFVPIMEVVLEEFGLHKIIRPGMGHVLFTLWLHDDVTMTNLVERTGLPASTLTRVIGEMEKAKLVSRSRCADDGRAVRIQLTPLGRSLESMGDRVVTRMRDVVEANMSKAEIKGVSEGLASMIDNMAAFRRKRGETRPSEHARGENRRHKNSNVKRVEALKPTEPSTRRPTP